MSEGRELDRLIDAALDTYAAPSPDANLAGKVLARLAEEHASRPRLRWFLWVGGAVPAVICLLLAVYSGLGIAKRVGPPPIPRAQVHELARNSVPPLPRATSRIVAMPQAAHPAPRKERLAAATAPHPLPKLDIFPTPTPLTPQERALAEYVARMPQAARRALAQSEQEETPLTVASIRVMPIELSDASTNTNF
jgi:hypothetical protein